MPMRLLQYGLIIVPSVLYILTLPMEREDVYTLYIIIAIGLAVCKDFARSSTSRMLLLLVEMLWNCWLIVLYGPFMLFLSLSVLYVYMYKLGGNLRWLMLGAQLLISNVALHWHYAAPSELPPWFNVSLTISGTPFTEETTGRIVGNLFLLIMAALSWQGAKTANSRGQLEQVYDEIRSKHYELQEARAQLLQFTKQLEGLAQAEERTRISRQLHDDIGHRLIRTKMMSEAALLTLPTNTEQGTVMVRQIRDQLAASMDDMRTTLHKLRSDSYLSDAYALDRLLEELGRETGVKTNYKVHGHSQALYPSIQIVLYKNAKEALTNALKHGNATMISIQLAFGEREVCMTVTNDGQIHSRPTKGSMKEHDGESHTDRSAKAESAKHGMGHEGMRMRAHSVGGTLEIQSDYPYTVITRLPITKQTDMI
ncbi:sensor histidine kinase [Paenibacillus sp. JNUCC31]|uniref:sensor histidine kinase n=1 Tax=Paenibacillus sp. JNUCC-31 TaxID=2777983 RepID=UPI00177EB277|nr:sensor histidine kinase [Paenibacillus sp. JNUCC-31]QOS81379.1 sensor histidine kinase [Paenibacillus sp. JNUCC-31]